MCSVVSHFDLWCQTLFVTYNHTKVKYRETLSLRLTQEQWTNSKPDLNQCFDQGHCLEINQTWFGFLDGGGGTRAPRGNPSKHG